MPDLKLNLVFGNHGGKFNPIFDGRVKADGIEFAASRMDIDQLFWRIPNKDDVDVAELSLTGTMWGMQHGKKWTAIPVSPAGSSPATPKRWCAPIPASKRPRI